MSRQKVEQEITELLCEKASRVAAIVELQREKENLQRRIRRRQRKLDAVVA